MKTEIIMATATTAKGFTAYGAAQERLCERLVKEGHLVRRERTAVIPAMTGAAAAHFAACGFGSPEARTVTLVSYHAADGAVAA